MNEHPTLDQIREMRTSSADQAMPPTEAPRAPSPEHVPAAPAHQPRAEVGSAATGDAAMTSAPPTAPATPAASTPGDGAILDQSDAQRLRARWTEVQGMFVDEPRTAVQQADALVAQVIDQVERTFADEKGALEREWNAGEGVETEALRLALRRYRAFFDRLLAL